MTARRLSLVLTLALVVWGGYTTIAYLGVPAHREVLVAAPGGVSGCDDDQFFCAGVKTLVPAVTHALGRWLWNPAAGELSLFAWWIGSSLLMLAIAVWRFGRRRPRGTAVRATPLHVLSGFVVMLWLLFTCLSVSKNGVVPYRRVFEATAQAYPGAGAEALSALAANVTTLEARGCLLPAGRDARGVAAFDLRVSCMQLAFFTRVLAPIGIVAALALVVLGLGAVLLGGIGGAVSWPERSLAVESVVAMVAGAGMLTVVLWALALSGFFTTVAVWLTLAGVVAVAAPGIARWGGRIGRHSWTWSGRPSEALWLWGLLAFVALNALSVIRPFPIGWDDLGLYLNKPRLLVSYGELIPSMGTFQWEYLTALGFGLFGYDSAFAATTALTINWAASVLAALAVYAMVRVCLPAGALAATVLFMTLPMVAQFSFADLKIDNAVFAAGTAAMLVLWLTLFPEPPPRGPKTAAAASDAAPNWRGVCLSGVLCGLAFSFKPTAIMLTLALGAVLAGVVAGPAGFGAAAAWSAALLAIVHVDAAEVSSRLGLAAGSVPSWAIALTLVAVGAGCAALAFMRRRASFGPAMRASLVFALGAALPVLPWLVTNNLTAPAGYRGLVFDASRHVPATFDLAGTVPFVPGRDVRRLPADLRLDLNACGATGKREELDRYWGGRTGLGHYATLPYRTVMNLDTSGYHVTTSPALLLFPLVLLLPWFWTREARRFRWLVATTACLIGLWVLLGHGIPWYGIAMFLGLVLAMVALITVAPTSTTRRLAQVLVGVALLLAVSEREGQYAAMSRHYEYPIGAASPDVVAERVVPAYDDISRAIEHRASINPSRPFAYRIGTFIAYFVPRNLDRLPLADNQLDFFACLNQERDAALTLRRLQALGFNSIVFDLAAASIESNPAGTLHRKVEAFLAFANTPGLGLEAAVTDQTGGVAYLLLP